MKKVFITGATGFVGQHLVRAAVAKGLSIRALVRSTADTSELRELGVELFSGDLTHPASLEGCCDGVDGVLHTACAVAGTFDSGQDARQRFLEVNRDGTVNLAREVLRHSGLRMVHISSTAAMGSPPAGRVDETTATNPSAPYQVSKRQAELSLLELSRNERLNVVILRPCLVAGEGKPSGELLKLFKMVKKGRVPMIGSTALVHKPLIMIDDLVDAALVALDRGRAGEIYLIHSNGDHTMGQIVETAGRLAGVRRTHVRVPVTVARLAASLFKLAGRFAPNWNPPLTPERLALFLTDRRIDITKARDELGFSPKHQDLDEILGRTYRWYADHGLV